MSRPVRECVDSSLIDLPVHQFCSESIHTLHSNHTGVSDQPFGDAETRLGAMNRAKGAYEAACSEIEDKNEHPDFSVGLEGGLEKQSRPQEPEGMNNQNKPDELWCMAWMAIFGSQSATCIAAKAEGDNISSEDFETKTSESWGFAKTGSFLLPPALCDLVINKRMELGDADDIVFKRVNSKHGQGTVGKLTDGHIDRTNYYVHALKLALIPWIRPELYRR